MEQRRYSPQELIEVFRLARIILKEAAGTYTLRPERDMERYQPHRVKFEETMDLMLCVVNEKYLDAQEMKNRFTKDDETPLTDEQVMALYREILEKSEGFGQEGVHPDGPLAGCYEWKSRFAASDDAADVPDFPESPTGKAAAIQWKRLNTLSGVALSISWVQHALNVDRYSYKDVDTSGLHAAIYTERKDAWHSLMTLALIGDTYTRAIITEKLATEQLVSRHNTRRSLEHLTSSTGSYFQGDRTLGEQIGELVNTQYGEVSEPEVDVNAALGYSPAE